METQCTNKLLNVDNCWHQIYQHTCVSTIVSLKSEKQATMGYMNSCYDVYCMIALADAYRICCICKHCVVWCLGEATCAIMTVANGAYYMFDPYSLDMTGFQNDRQGAILLHFQS